MNAVGPKWTWTNKKAHVKKLSVVVSKKHPIMNAVGPKWTWTNKKAPLKKLNVVVPKLHILVRPAPKKVYKKVHTHKAWSANDWVANGYVK